MSGSVHFITEEHRMWDLWKDTAWSWAFIAIVAIAIALGA